ncbi:MAG: arsenic metallochaperone ArsD family protein [Oxalobacter formigenes]|nr:arsenic metallochaperone ArsD family protein [Oxalobacter formigenes]
MDIQVFGFSTEKTAALARQCQLAAAETGSNITVRKIASRDRITEMGIDNLPAVAINGIILSSGRIPARQEISAWISEAAGTPSRNRKNPLTAS